MIRVLRADVVDRIAAGEVVERPASVVKELLENALDAGASRIDVRIERGGMGLVRVADNGCGMEARDLELSFRSHATSKLADVGDLAHIASFGFRGEALSSIAAVSRSRILSSTGQNGLGIECHGGTVSQPHPAACAQGTVVEVRDLFFNTPARRGFLGSEGAEAARCREVCAAMALATPSLVLSFEHGAKSAFRADGASALSERIAAVYGQAFRRGLVPVRARGEGLAVEGFLTLPAAARARPRAQLLFVNGRLVRDRGVTSAVRVACRDFLPGSLQPAWVLLLAVDPARVDVNVHPTKAEVRFRDRDAVFRLVRAASRNALLAGDLTPRVTVGRPLASPAIPRAPSAAPASGVVPDPRLAVAETAPAVPERAPAPVRRYLQVLDTYLVHDSPEGLVIVDQHALHERVLLAQLQRKLEEGRLECQHLLVPEVVRLDPSEVERVRELGDSLARLGLQAEPFGVDSVAIQAVPAVLRGEPIADLLRALLDPTDPHGGLPSGLDRRLFTLACHAAVKAGDRLDEDQIADLLRQGRALEHDATCPHGRPTRLVIGKTELERLFKRSGF